MTDIKENTDEALGRVARNAYWNTDSACAWDMLSDGDKSYWIAAAKAVAEAVKGKTKDSFEEALEVVVDRMKKEVLPLGGHSPEIKLCVEKNGFDTFTKWKVFKEGHFGAYSPTLDGALGAFPTAEDLRQRKLSEAHAAKVEAEKIIAELTESNAAQSQAAFAGGIDGMLGGGK